MLLAHAGVYLHTTLRGKLQVWRRLLDRLALDGDEYLLDLGCGRGAVLIQATQGRSRALDEAVRVLRPGGHLLIADFWPMAKSHASYLGHGTLQGLGPGYWYGGPWFGVALLHATKA